MSAAALARRIVVECLHCGHCGTLREADLARYGERPGAPIASFVKRLTCSECGSHSVRAYRRDLEQTSR
ncbi:MAG TPA: hypothetical protein VNR11_21730 [Xanthobacteraceae bacterium]|nr:hypothetical protein [Xanthobacteraceae bacterium]